ncbi:MAG TPA: hypothetical protein VFF16_07665 [Telluria sp.]|nr:hypothetical protein [Telluria sp.]
MPLLDTLGILLGRVSRRLGLETIDAFPPGHPYERTRWNRAYFDIPSDMAPEAIERTLCAAIANTPTVFAHITHPTPRMQQELLNAIEQRLRRDPPGASALAALLVDAYASRHTLEARPGLRAALADSAHLDRSARAQILLAWLADTPAGYGVIDMH